MDAAQYPLMRAQEERHWWYRGNRAILRRLLMRWRPARCERRLDAGCGTGQNLTELADLGTPIGLDFAEAALAHCRQRGLTHLVRGSVTELPFATGSLDVVTCLEVLYHRAIPDWQSAIAELARVVRPGGLLVLREPAFAALRGSHDTVVHGSRRFRRRELRRAVEQSGLEILRCSYQNLVTFAPALILRSWQRFRGTAAAHPEADFDHGSGPLGAVFAQWLAFEGFLLQYLRLPVGSSVLCVARRRTAE